MEKNPTEFFPSEPAEKEDSCAQKRRLLQALRVCTFALTEARLYLDTHPSDSQALACYRAHEEERLRLEKEWARLANDTSTDTPNDCWDYVRTPWPWQSEA